MEWVSLWASSGWTVADSTSGRTAFGTVGDRVVDSCQTACGSLGWGGWWTEQGEGGCSGWTVVGGAGGWVVVG